MKIVSYNMRLGGAGLKHWALLIDRLNPDVVLAQETYAPQLHLPPATFGDIQQQVQWTPLGALRWGTAVFVRNRAPRALELPDFHGSVIGVEVKTAPSFGRACRLFSIHAPRRGSYAKSVSQILDMIQPYCVGFDVVLGGDFNLSVSKRQPPDARAIAKADLAIQARLRDEFGLINCWEQAHPDQTPTQTLRWSGDGGKCPYHCDGIFVPRRWASRLSSCGVLSGEAWDGLSDHNPVVAEFARMAIRPRKLASGAVYPSVSGALGNVATRGGKSKR
jgi:endonuclease/exonuclease/phosphatase family metal-dependent hydrolase